MTIRFQIISPRVILCAAAVFAVTLASTASAIVIEAFDGTRSARPFSGADYSNIRADLLNPANFGPAGIVTDSVTFAPDVSSVTPANLAGVNFFIVSEVGGGLSGSEITALHNFVLGGGGLILVTDSAPSAGNGLSQMLFDLDGGGAGGLAGTNSANGGSIVGAGRSTNGPFGVLALGTTYAVSNDAPLTLGSASVLVGTDGGSNELLEIPVGALGAGSGPVLAAGDVSFMNFFVPPASLFNEPNNATLFENSIGGPTGTAPTAVPEPATTALVTLSLAGLSLLGLRRRK